MPRLLVAITPHGYGHAVQVAPVLEALYAQVPSLELYLITIVPEAFLRDCIRVPFVLESRAPDFGLHMHSALAIDLPGSAQAYARLHADWEVRVDEEARRLDAIGPDLVLADVPALTLAAARRAGIPAWALCSLNWADIYVAYFSGRPEAPAVLEDLRTAYASAQGFIQPEPSMPMEELDNRFAVGPIGRTGRADPAALRASLGLDAQTALVLVSLGGVAARFELTRWPRISGLHWIVPDDWDPGRPDITTLGEVCGAMDMRFIDVLASADAVLGKCGYGTVTECVLNATPLLHLPRQDWPEDPCLASWLRQHDAGLALAPQSLEDGSLTGILDQLRSLQPRRRKATGADQAAVLLARALGELPGPAQGLRHG
ncbi:MAG TPA: hypothetical protein ENJ79_07270 [Gammaproteobacteria bacterium]|nr:hypothetical protein [Gammaproteobacteria bacterium]